MLRHATTCMNHGNSMLNERNQSQKTTYCIDIILFIHALYCIALFHLYEMPRIEKSIESESKLVVAR